MLTPSDCAAMAEELLSHALPMRWRHTQGVARAARDLAPLAGPDADLLESAAWLHDIGYAPTLARTGFHPLDGAEHLATIGVDSDLVTLVANHTNAGIEAAQRGLHDLLSEVTHASLRSTLLLPLLARADMTTSPSGDPITIEARLADIYRRYGVDHVVHRSIRLAERELLALRNI